STATWASYRRNYLPRAMVTLCVQIFQPRGLSSVRAPRDETFCQAETSRAGPGDHVTMTKIDGKQLSAEQAQTEEQLVRQHLPLVQYVVSEVAHRVPNHVSRSELVS